MEARISRKKSLPLSLLPPRQENNNERIMNLNQQQTMHLSMLDNLESHPPSHKISDAYLSSTGRGEREGMMMKKGPISSAPNTPESLRKGSRDKKEKMEFNQMMLRSLRPLSYHGSICLDHPHSHHNTPPVVNKRHIASSRGRKEGLQANRRSMPYSQRDKIDVSELDTNLPRIDMEVIETHLRQAREEERKRRTEREEIRRRLALEAEGSGADEKPQRKHNNLHSRLQSMHLQICFMNSYSSDSESPNSDSESQRSQPLPQQKREERVVGAKGGGGGDFVAKQLEVKQLLAQAKEVARLQLTRERAGRAHSPITEMVRNSLEKVGVALPPDRRRVSRQLLTELGVGKLQVIVNDLHSHIEKLNEKLVGMLLERDELHMEQDSVLVDIEDYTRYLAAKKSPHHSMPLASALGPKK